GAVFTLVEPVPVDDGGYQGGQQAHEDYHNVDLLSNDSLLKPDQGHDHGNLTPWCHTKPEDEAVLSAQSRQSTRDGTADNLCYDRDEGENDQEPQDGHRELVHIGKDA